MKQTKRPAEIGIACLVLTTMTAFGWARHASAADVSQRVAVFPAGSKGKPAAKWTQAIDKALADIAPASASVINGRSLARQMRGDPSALALKCNTDVGCLAGLAEKLKVGRLILPRVSPDRNAIRLEVLVFRSSDRSLNTPLQQRVARTGELPQVLSRASSELFHDDADDLEAELALVPLNSEDEDVGLLRLEALPDENAQTSPALGATPSRTSWRLYAGLTAAATGVGAVIAAGVFGLQARNTYARADSPASTQLEAQTHKDQGDSLVGRANVGFAVGGGLLAASLGLLLWETLGDSRKEKATVQVGFAPNGGTMHVRW